MREDNKHTGKSDKISNGARPVRDFDAAGSVSDISNGVKKKKVMVVDDEEDFLGMVRLNLEGTGKYEIMVLSSAKDIITRAHAFKPDIILLDFLMPKVDGVEACEMLNNDSIGRNIPLIIISALDKDTDKLRAYKLGVVDYLVKPIGKSDLIAKIEKALKFK